MDDSINIIKVRDDPKPTKLKLSENEGTQFEIVQDGSFLSSQDKTCTFLDLRGKIEPWLTALFQSEHLSLLVGSGLTTAIQITACGASDNGMDSFSPKTKYADQLKKSAKESALLADRGEEPNLEDYIRVMNELLRGLEILGNSEELKELSDEIVDALKDFTNNISEIEKQIATAPEEKRISAFNQLVLFLMSFASRTGTRDRLNIFTTNYDRLIEAGSDIAGIRLIDRFVGALSPEFRSSRLDIDMHYNPPGIRGEPRYLEGVVRFTKLHGSIDWINTDRDIRRIGLPFGADNVQPYLNAPGLNEDASKIMIYPNSSKDRETSEYPYVELFRDFSAAICQPNSTLVTYGYSFRDEHINRVIRDMLTIPSTHLVVIAYDDVSGRIMQYFDDWGRQSQMSLIVGKDVANIDTLVNYYLPKPAIDKTTMRMSELLEKRFNYSAKNE